MAGLLQEAIEVLDRLKMRSNPHVTRMLEKEGSDGEFVIWSSILVKVNKRAKKQTRVLLITDRALYNLSTTDYKKVKRRIPIGDLSKVVISTQSDQVVLYVPSDYDFKIITGLKDEIAEVLKVLYHKQTFTELEVEYKDTDDLSMVRKSKTRRSLVNELSSPRASQKVTKQKSVQFGKVSINDFEMLELLGQGNFGKVVKVRKIDNGKMYAMKVMKKTFVLENEQLEHIMAERHILAAFENPFIMTLHYAFQSKSNLYLVMELYSGGELLDHLHKKGKFTEPEARFIVAELTIALGHLHSLDIVYRDLKPENVLMDSLGHIVLTDFGLAKQLNTDNPESNTFCGTPHYIAPELLLALPHNKSVDFWSLGIMLYELVSGLPPFYGDNMDEIYHQIVESPIPLNRLPKDLSPECADLIKKLLVRDPSERLGSLDDAQDIISHPWMANVDWSKILDKAVSPPYKPEIVDTGSPSQKRYFMEETASGGDVYTINFDGFTFCGQTLDSLLAEVKSPDVEVKKSKR